MTDTTTTTTTETNTAPAPEVPPRVSRRTVRGIAADSLGAGTRLIALGSIIVSVMVTICFMGVSILIILLMMRLIAASNVDPNITSTLSTMWTGLLVLQTAIVNYWCGSSSGSARKDHIQSIETTASVNAATQGRTT